MNKKNEDLKKKIENNKLEITITKIKKIQR